jgi:hypothetical protein|tara:strand:+ start:333 stop:503 length:171 start_codon:yes stop_codon:yes gene_type:complete
MYLVIERIAYVSSDDTYTVAQQTLSEEKAKEYLKALITLNDNKNQKKSYSIVEVPK